MENENLIINNNFLLKNYNNNDNIQKFKLYCNCQSYFQDSNIDIIYFKIYLKSYLTNIEWEINRSYSDFYEYYYILTKIFYNLPKLQKLINSKKLNLVELDLIKNDLNRFLRVNLIYLSILDNTK